MEITRSGILRDVLEEKNREMYRYSKHQAGLEPIEGYEKHFDDLKKTCDLLRGMIRNAEDREREAKVQQYMADWQLEVIKADCAGEHPKLDLEPAEAPPNMTWDAERQQWVPIVSVDEVLRRRRYQKAEGFKPGPVTYPGGE